jgi:poly(3-hydroxybutyrate) depolymerase
MHSTKFPNLSTRRRLPAKSDVLSKLEAFGSNPGQLDAWTFVPELRGDKASPLVVVLHGCTQTASDYNRGSGWSELAEAYGFAVLLPEQRRSNNANLCFNWFEPRTPSAAAEKRHPSHR